MTTEGRIPGWVNPLAFTEVDEPWAPSTQAEPTLEAILRFLCSADELVDIDNLVARYRQISTEPVRLLLAPAEQRILAAAQREGFLHDRKLSRYDFAFRDGS